MLPTCPEMCPFWPLVSATLLLYRRPECQQKFGHVRMEGAGRGNGEPHEIINAALAPSGKTTMYMTRLNRQVRSFW